MRISDWSSDVCSSDLVDGSDEIRVVVLHALETADMADGEERRACKLADPFGDEIGGRENFGRLSVEHQVIVAEMRAADVPVKILGLEIDPIGIGQQSVERGLNVAHLVRIDVRRGGELASNGLGLVCR